jgi:hypothetical protein
MLSRSNQMQLWWRHRGCKTRQMALKMTIHRFSGYYGRGAPSFCPLRRVARNPARAKIATIGISCDCRV